MSDDRIDELQSSVKDIGPTRREIEAEIPAAAAAPEYARILTDYAQRARLKGFRQGKAPLDVVKQMFGHDIEHAVVDALVPRALGQALDDAGLHSAGVPVVESVSFEEGGPLKFKAAVEIWPDFALPAYKGVKTKAPQVTVTDEDVDRALGELREKAVEYVPVEGRGAADGDYVVVEIQGRDLKTKRLMPVEKVVVLAGHEGNDPAINANLTGLAPGGTKTFVHAYPPDHKARKLAGKEIEYRLKVDSIKEKKLPEANDDFAKTLGEFDTLAAVKDKIREEIRMSREQSARRETSDEVLREIVGRAAIDLPASVLAEESEAVLKSLLQSAPRTQLTPELLESLRGAAGTQAELNLKRHLLLRRIAEVEGIRVTEADVDAEIKALAQANRIPVERAMESFARDDRRDELASSLLTRRTVDFLVGQAIMD
jgi:trigger factor